MEVPLIRGSFSINTVNALSIPYDFLNLFFSVAYFIVIIQYYIQIHYTQMYLYIIHITYRMLIDCMLSVRLPLNSRLLVVKFGGTHKLYLGF